MLIKIEEQVDASTEEIPSLDRARARGAPPGTVAAPVAPGSGASGAAGAATGDDEDELGMSDEPTAPGLAGAPPGTNARSKPPSPS